MMLGHRRFLKRIRADGAVGTWPQITTMGTESAMQSRTGVTVLVAPGPEVTRHTPTRPLARA